ncbi:TPA: hypothetical protein U1B35_001130 [Streptococcus suis]|uniref:hypothetical protein n=1 Tax=Streptococcus suis TaxID=1307 RepID=UPI000D65F3E9|nr:hypothetical protein [Streptococcus suis]AWL26799.1 hypothetical protein DF184_09735 [Streptococcus suis]MCO8178998.1 hypothetical protein [Streptococcus suis]HEM3465556.1 hypothetical protein [Streptococcus suis]HEM3537451.1 hypothetical protein [Streptococcus suis]
MNKRIKKKKAKQARQRELEQLEQELAKLSPEQLEAIADAISQAVQAICTVISYFAENIAEALRRWEERLDKEDSNQD